MPTHVADKGPPRTALGTSSRPNRHPHRIGQHPGAKTARSRWPRSTSCSRATARHEGRASPSRICPHGAAVPPPKTRRHQGSCRAQRWGLRRPRARQPTQVALRVAADRGEPGGVNRSGHKRSLSLVKTHRGATGGARVFSVAKSAICQAVLASIPFFGVWWSSHGSILFSTSPDP